MLLFISICSSVLFMSNSGCGDDDDEAPSAVVTNFSTDSNIYWCNGQDNPEHLTKVLNRGSMHVNITSNSAPHFTYDQSMNNLSSKIDCPMSGFECCTYLEVPDTDDYTAQVWFFENYQTGCVGGNGECFRWVYMQEFYEGTVPDCQGTQIKVSEQSSPFEGPCGF